MTSTHPATRRSLRLAVAALAALVASGPVATGRAESRPGSGQAVAEFVLPIEAGAVARPFIAPAHRYASGHRGVDLRAGPGSPVTSPADGTVSFVGQVAGRDVVSIDHGGGWRSAIEPVRADIAEGDWVRRGQPVGTVGSGGHCDGACVHWGVRIDGDYVDPMTLVEMRVILLPLQERPSAVRGQRGQQLAR